MKLTKEKTEEVLALLRARLSHRKIRDLTGASLGSISNIRNDGGEYREPKILVYDIETAPIMAAVWKMWEANVVWTEKDWYMLSFSAKWLGEEKVHNFSLNQYKGYKAGSEDDKKLCADLWKMMDEADIVVAHNGDCFDNKKASARFIIHQMMPPSPYQSIDTLKVARRYFKFSSNKLNSLGEYFKLGSKVETGGYKLWQGCLAGDKDSWNKMVLYNEQDVSLLEKVYLKLRPWMKSHPSLSNISGDTIACPKCGSTDVVKNGTTHTKFAEFQQYTCKACGGHLKGNRAVKKDKPEFKPN